MTLDRVGAHEAAYRRLVEAVGAGRDEEADEVLAAEFVDHNPWGTADLLGALQQIGAVVSAPGDP